MQAAQSYAADELALSGELPNLEAALAYRKACIKGIDVYIAFRCNESLPNLEKHIAEAKATAPAPTAPN